MKKKLLLSAFLLSGFLLTAQTPSFNWAKRIGAGSYEMPNKILSDATGNVFVMGNYDTRTDFDPGPGTYTLAPAPGNAETFLVKLDASGNFVWARSFGHDFAAGFLQSTMSFDPAGNIMIAGMYTDVADFDPGPGTYTLSTTLGNASNSYLLKLDANGNFMWVKDFISLTPDGMSAFADIHVDAAGNISLIGVYNDLYDFDPDPVTSYTLNPASPGNMNYVVLKLNATGDFTWAKAIENTTYIRDSYLSIANDQQGNVLFSGPFFGTVDFDPGAGSYTLTTTAQMFQGSSFVAKLDASGNFVWAAHADSPNGAWVSHKDLTCDNAGNVYVCGWGDIDADLDPGPAVFSSPATSATEQGYLFKLSPSGNFVWGNFIIGDNSSECASLTFNTNGDLLILGDYAGTFDFDGGTGTFMQTSPGQSFAKESFMCSYNTAGGFLWANAFGGGAGGVSMAKSIAANNTGIYALGFFEVAGDYDPTAGTSILTPVADIDTYILKLTACIAPPSPINTTIPSRLSVCAGTTTTLSVNSSSGTVSWYASPTSTTTIGSGTVYVTSTLTAGTYTYYADANTCAASPRTVITVTATTFPVLTASTFSSTICSGSSTTLTANAPTPVTYSWNTGASTASITVSPTVTTTYTVTGTNACGTASTSVTQYVYNCTGLYELTNAGDISIYPNPAHAVVSIAIPGYLASGSTIVEVCDALGKLVMKETLTHDLNTFNISGLEDGIYFFKVLNNNQTIKTGKVVKH